MNAKLSDFKDLFFKKRRLTFKLFFVVFNIDTKDYLYNIKYLKQAYTPALLTAIIAPIKPDAEHKITSKNKFLGTTTPPKNI